jgi:hypothetical protein
VIEGGAGRSDGTALAFLDPAVSGPEALGTAEQGLGFGGLTGVAVMLNTVSDLFWSGANQVAVVRGHGTGGVEWLDVNINVPSLFGTHRVDVSYDAGALVVVLDGAEAARTPVELPPDVLVGFTAANGAGTGAHIVRDVAITPATPGI